MRGGKGARPETPMTAFYQQPAVRGDPQAPPGPAHADTVAAQAAPMIYASLDDAAETPQFGDTARQATTRERAERALERPIYEEAERRVWDGPPDWPPWRRVLQLWPVRPSRS